MKPKQYLTSRQAADVIGCGVHQVRNLVRQGKLSAKRSLFPNQYGYCFRIAKEEVEQYASQPQTQGYPRGRKRI